MSLTVVWKELNTPYTHSLHLYLSAPDAHLNTGAQKEDHTILSFVYVMKFLLPSLCDEASGKDVEM